MTIADRAKRVRAWIEGGGSSWGAPMQDIEALTDAAERDSPAASVMLKSGDAVLAYPGCPSAWRIKPEDMPKASSLDALRWENAADPISPADLVAFAGEIEVGGVVQSTNGLRFRWEIVSLSGGPAHRSGWSEALEDAKAKVQELWDAWKARAGL